MSDVKERLFVFRIAGKDTRIPKDSRSGLGSVLSSSGWFHHADFTRTLSDSGDSETVQHDLVDHGRHELRQVQFPSNVDIDSAKHFFVDSLWFR
jgi:hypothetical protein